MPVAYVSDVEAAPDSEQKEIARAALEREQEERTAQVHAILCELEAIERSGRTLPPAAQLRLSELEEQRKSLTRESLRVIGQPDAKREAELQGILVEIARLQSSVRPKEERMKPAFSRLRALVQPFGIQFDTVRGAGVRETLRSSGRFPGLPGRRAA